MDASIYLDRLFAGLDGFVALAVGFGGYFDTNETYRFKSFKEEFWPWPDQANVIVDKALEHAPKADVYVCPLLRRERSRKAGTGGHGRFAWADLDVQPPNGWTELVGPSSFAVRSGRGQHLYLWLPDPLPAAELERLNRRLAQMLDADAGWSETKYLRLPGTWNHKGAARGGVPLPVTFLETEPGDHDWTLAELDQFLPDLQKPSSNGSRPEHAEPPPVARLPRHIEARLREEPNGDRSAQTAGLVAACVEWGLPDDQVHVLALQHMPTLEKYGDRTGREIERLLAKLRPEHPHVGQPCDRAGCPNRPDWMSGDPAAGVVVVTQPLAPYDGESRERPTGAPSPQVRKMDGATFVFASPLEIPAIWGRGDEILWTPGEGLMVVGPDGVGKTTIVQQLILCRIGLRDKLLGLSVAEADGVVVYLAMDRPAQAARSMRRMADKKRERALRERLRVWKGPLPIDVLKRPGMLADWIEGEFPEASDIFVDSLKDLAPKLSDDDVGSRINLARQEVLARGLQVVESHHQRKEQRGQGKPKTLADVYGSRWLTAGTGSVVLLWGDPGDPVVELVHLKQPAEDVGPLTIVHDHRQGISTRDEGPTLETLVGSAHNGLSVADATRLLFKTDGTPSRNQIEKARRRLERLVEHGHAQRRDDPDGTARYHARQASA